MIILLTMFFLGGVIGFIGVGGAAMVVSILTFFFGIPIHTALGISLGAMAFTTFSGTISHLRDGNLVLKTGLTIGIFASSGAFIGAHLAHYIPSSRLKYMTASLLYISAVLAYLRLFSHVFDKILEKNSGENISSMKFFVICFLIGFINGLLAGTFGFGAAQFIQLSMLMCFSFPLNKIVGTTMLIMLPMGFFGSVGYLASGSLDLRLFAEVVFGLMCGAYIGAKFTKRSPSWLLKTAMVSLPIIGGTLLIL